MRIRKQKTLIDRAHDYVEAVAETVIPQLEAAYETARDRAGPAISDARDKVAPVIAEGRAIAAEKASAGAASAAEKLAEGRALAAEKASAGAASAAERAATSRDFAATKVAEFRHEPEPKGSKLKKVLLLGGLLAIGGAVFAKLRQQSSGSNNWQSSYVPTPPPAKPTPAAPVTPVTPAAPNSGAQVDGDASDDVAGGAPGEAISDAAVTPHEVTTPDAPAEIIDIDDVPDNKS